MRKEAICKVFNAGKALRWGAPPPRPPRSPRPGEILALAWSGGKDSALLLDKALRAGYKVQFLFNLIDKKAGLSLTPPFNKQLAELQAQALGLPLLTADLTGDPRKKLKAFLRGLARRGVRAVGSGHIAPAGQRDFIAEAAAAADLGIYEPLCGISRRKLFAETLKAGIRAAVVGVNTGKVDARVLGSLVTAKLRDYLALRGLDICGENDEYHTLTLDSPRFSRKLRIAAARRIPCGSFEFLYVSRAQLIEKGAAEET